MPIDGKALRNSQGLEVLGAYSVNDGRWLGSELVAADSNEIPAAQELPRRAPIESSLGVQCLLASFLSAVPVERAA